jgi:hypothetical protein
MDRGGSYDCGGEELRRAAGWRSRGNDAPRQAGSGGIGGCNDEQEADMQGRECRLGSQGSDDSW